MCTLAQSVQYISVLHSDAPSVCSLTADGFTSHCPHPPGPPSQCCRPCPERSVSLRGGGPSHTTPMRTVAFSPVQAAQQGRNTSLESAHTGRLRRFWLWLQIRRRKNLLQRFNEINTSGSLAGLFAQTVYNTVFRSFQHPHRYFYPEAPLLVGSSSYKFYSARQRSGSAVSRDKRCIPIFSKPSQWRMQEWRWHYWYLAGLSIRGLELSGPVGSWSSVSWVWVCSSSHSTSSTRPRLELRDLAMAP